MACARASKAPKSQQRPPKPDTSFKKPLPAAGSVSYSFALDRALVVLSPACVAKAGLAANADNGDASTFSR